MQPENSHQTFTGLEHAPTPPSVAGETVPSLPPVEAAPLGQVERFEQAAEAGVRASDVAAPANPVTIPAPPAPQTQPPQATPLANTPLIAADEDIIEKEWVDKAKEIIEQTKDDPFRRSEQVGELQRDYLQKRYGKVVGASE